MKAYLLPLLTAVATPIYAQNTIEVLDAYPACDYTVIEKAKATDRVIRLDHVVSRKALDKSFQDAKNKLLDKATDLQADALILTAKYMRGKSNIGRSTGNKLEYMLTLEGEIINSCTPIAGRTAEPAPVTPDGRKREVIKLENAEIAMQVEFQVKDKSNQKLPINNYQLSNENGVYGAKLGMTVSKVKALFGEPSVNLTPENDWQLLGYGRSHWFIFHKNALQRVSSGTQFLTNSLVNFVPFDERFDDQLWSFTTSDGDKLTYKAAMNSTEALAKIIAERPQTLTFEQGNHGYSFAVTYNVTVSTEEVTPQITGFTHYLLDAPTFEHLPLLPSTSPYRNIENWLSSNPSSETMTMSDFDSKPVGFVNADRDQLYVIFDNNLVGRLNGDSLDKVFMFESVFRLDGKTKMQLSDKLMGIGLGDDIDEVRSNAKGEIFEFGDTIEISQSGYTYNVYLNEENGKEIVYQSELLLY